MVLTDKIKINFFALAMRVILVHASTGNEVPTISIFGVRVISEGEITPALIGGKMRKHIALLLAMTRKVIMQNSHLQKQKG